MSANGPIDIPNKSSFKVNEVCAITGVKSYVLRFWESEFEEISPLVSSNGNKVYEHRDIEAILMIKKLLFEDKLSIDRAKAQMKMLMPRGSMMNDSVMPKALMDYAEGDFDDENLEEIENDYFALPKQAQQQQMATQVQEIQVTTAKIEVKNIVHSSETINTSLNSGDLQKLGEAKRLLAANRDLIKAIKSKNHWL